MSTQPIGADSELARPPVDSVTGLGSAAPAPTASRERSGVITLARHGEPNISRKVKLHAAEYAAWWGRYEQTGLLPGQAAPASLVSAARVARVILCSTRLRSIESARAIAGERDFEIDEQFIEAPLPPPRWPRWIKLTPRNWGVVSRFCWWVFNHHDGQERRKAAQSRADEAADRLMTLADAGADVLLIAHGFFNLMISVSLKRRGWILVENRGFNYWSSRRFVRRGG
jgi:broad specificity phosphatase PhoE